jgi:16S rRNA (guanine527-N7)-methyltransferase
MDKDKFDFFKDTLNEIGICLDSDTIKTILSYFECLMEKNKSVNLISRQSNIYEAIVLHLVDSLSIIQLGLPRQNELLDLGSGGGLPGIPLAIANPKWVVTLVESKAKKCVFLKEIADNLDQKRIIILNQFLETNGRSLPEKHGFFDMVTVRAVDKLKSLIPTVAKLLKNGGSLIAYKGPNYESELEQAKMHISKCRLVLENKYEFILPFVNAKRTLLCFRKIL